MANWNRLFTEQIRQSRWALWGNWSLDDQIQPGAVGTLTPDGNFASVGRLSGLTITDTASATQWEVATSTVSRKTRTGNPTAAAGVSGVSASATVDVTWTFQSANSFSSEFALARESSIDTVAAIQANLPALKEMAGGVGMLVDGNITQGFGVVATVLYAASGVNVGALSDNTSFTVSGNAQAVYSMLGSIKGTGSYTATDESSATDHHLWPATPDTVSTDPVPIAYAFASFQGGVVIPNWTQPLTSLRVALKSDLGCTYITDATVTYTSASAGGSKTQKIRVPGGASGTIDLPLDAQQVSVDMTFVGSKDTLHVTSEAPLGQWPTGVCAIDVWGVWPGGAHSKVAYP